MTDAWNHLELVRRRFTERSANWRDLYTHPQNANHLVLIDRKEIALALLKSCVKPPARLADVGCGAGVASVAAARLGYTVLGLDFSEAMIHLAREAAALEPPSVSQRLEFDVCAVDGDLARRGKLDAIIALGFLEYQKNERRTLLALNAALKPHGILVVSGPAEIRLSNLCGLARTSGGISLHRYGRRRFRQLLTDAGFELLRQRQHGFADFRFLTGLPSKRRIEFRLHRTFTAISRFMPLDRLGNDIVVLARKKRSFQRMDASRVVEERIEVREELR